MATPWTGRLETQNNAAPLLDAVSVHVQGIYFNIYFYYIQVANGLLSAGGLLSASSCCCCCRGFGVGLIVTMGR